MSEVKKLTEEEIKQIRDMQAQYNRFIFDLGSLEAQLQNILMSKKAVEDEKNNVIEDIKKIADREKELVEILQEKYGNGNIDIETGEITPA